MKKLFAIFLLFASNANAALVWKLNFQESGSGVIVATATVGPNADYARGAEATTTIGPGGQFPKAFLTNGTSDRAQTTADATLDQNGEMTLCMWVKPATVAAGVKALAANGDATTSFIDWAMEINRTAGRFGGTWGGAAISTSSTTMNTSTWYHVAMVRTGSTGAWTVTLYLNGVQDGQNTSAVNPNGTTQLAAVGRYGGATFWSNASFADVRLYSHALTAADLLVVMADGKGLVSRARNGVSRSRAMVANR